MDPVDASIYIAVAALTASILALAVSVKAYGTASRAIRAVVLLKGSGKEVIVKPRKRYIAFSLVCDKPVDKGVLEDAFTRLYTEYFGKSTLQKASPQLILFLEDKQAGVLRTSHLYRDHTVAVLGALKHVGDSKCVVIPLKTCGSLRKCREAVERKR